MNRTLMFAVVAAFFGIIIFGSLNALSNTVRRGHAAASAVVGEGCKIGGCSSQFCLEAGQNVVSTCEYRQAYGCYKSARCERQPTTGLCGWSPTADLVSCLARNRSP